MGFLRAFVVMAALGLATTLSALPTQVASAQPPSTQVLVPSTGATVSGTQVVLDASASAGVTKVQFEVTGGTLNDLVIATATPTIYGWVAQWNSTAVVSGTYTLQSVATAAGSSATSPGISITVSNGGPPMSVVLPPPGGTVSGTQAVFDAVGPAGVSDVSFGFSLPLGSSDFLGCPLIGQPGDQQPFCTFSATPTIYGWIAVWNSTDVQNGTYQVLAGCGQCGANLTTTPMAVVNPAATVVVPANGATLVGSQVLDCVPPASYDDVSFYIEGPNVSGSGFVGNGTPTYYGWLYEWNTTSVASGIYGLYCTAGSPSTGATAISPAISVNVG
jgi:Bacterial Ig domain